MNKTIIGGIFFLLSCGSHSMTLKKSPQYSSEQERYVNRPSPRMDNFKEMGLLETLKAVKQMFFGKETLTPKSPIPEVKPQMKSFLEPSKHLKFIWLGHSTLLLNVDRKIILVDPVFSDYAFSLDIFAKRFQAPVLSLKELPPIDVIVISHDHYDHLDQKSIEFFKSSETRFLVPLGVSEDLLDWGIKKDKIVELDWDESITEAGIQFTATPAQHFSGRSLFDRNKTLWASWVIQGAKEKIYYSGDSGYGGHFKEIGEKYGPFDLTFIENGQYNEKWANIHMMPDETIQAHLDLKGKYFVPVHWGMFKLALHHWLEPVQMTSKLAEEKGISYLTPRLGEIMDLGSLPTARPWWEGLEEQKVLEQKIIPLTNL